MIPDNLDRVFASKYEASFWSPLRALSRLLIYGVSHSYIYTNQQCPTRLTILMFVYLMLSAAVGQEWSGIENPEETYCLLTKPHVSTLGSNRVSVSLKQGNVCIASVGHAIKPVILRQHEATGRTLGDYKRTGKGVMILYMCATDWGDWWRKDEAWTGCNNITTTSIYCFDSVTSLRTSPPP